MGEHDEHGLIEELKCKLKEAGKAAALIITRWLVEELAAAGEEFETDADST